MIYQFKTSATMKPYNNKKWWIDDGIIREITIIADTVKNALIEYQTIVHDKYYIDISNNAIKNPEPMYIDTKSGEPKQTGFVITAKTEFDNDRREWVTQYIDLWVSIAIITNPFETEV